MVLAMFLRLVLVNPLFFFARHQLDTWTPALQKTRDMAWFCGCWEFWVSSSKALPQGGGGPMSPVWILKRLVLVFINACRLLLALPSLSQFGRGRLSLVAISFYTLLLLFGPCCLSKFTLAGPQWQIQGEGLGGPDAPLSDLMLVWD